MNSIVSSCKVAPRLNDSTADELSSVSGGGFPKATWPNSGASFFDRGSNVGVVFDLDGYHIGNGDGTFLYVPYNRAA
jgi:hypothetical protein